MSLDVNTWPRAKPTSDHYRCILLQLCLLCVVFFCSFLPPLSMWCILCARLARAMCKLSISTTRVCAGERCAAKRTSGFHFIMVPHTHSIKTRVYVGGGAGLQTN